MTDEKTFLSRLEWRNATKSFDITKKVSDENLQKIKDAIRLAPSSFGLQPYKVVVVEDPELRAAIQPHAWNQGQITEASHLLVFCARTDVGNRIDSFLDIMSGGDDAKKEDLKGYADLMRGFIGQKEEAEVLAWTQRQTYIAQGFCLAACAELEIDSCPIEGFVPTEVDKILNLPPYLKSSVIVAIGYRDDSPIRPKVRFGEDDLFETV